MLSKLILALVSLATVTAATAQDNCAKPTVKLLLNNQEVVATGSALAPSVALRVVPEAGCPEQVFRFRNAEITLVRNGRPVLPSVRTSQAQLDLRSFMRAYQSGDHLLIFIAYQNLAVTDTDGTLLPLSPVKPAKPAPRQLDLLTDDSKGISFKWTLVK